MKTFTLIAIIVLCGFLEPVYAQSIPPRPPNTDHMLRQVQQMQRQQDMRRFQQQSANDMLRNNYWATKNKKKNLQLFKIVYADSTEEQVMSHLEFTLVSHTLVIETGIHREISPGQTLYISTVVQGTELKGWASDSCWLFKTTTGKINAYSYTPEFNTKKIVCVQKGDTGQMLSCTSENVAPLVADNQEALRVAQRKKYLAAILIYNQ